MLPGSRRFGRSDALEKQASLNEWEEDPDPHFVKIFEAFTNLEVPENADSKARVWRKIKAKIRGKNV